MILEFDDFAWQTAAAMVFLLAIASSGFYALRNRRDKPQVENTAPSLSKQPAA